MFKDILDTILKHYNGYIFGFRSIHFERFPNVSL